MVAIGLKSEGFRALVERSQVPALEPAVYSRIYYKSKQGRVVIYSRLYVAEDVTEPSMRHARIVLHDAIQEFAPSRETDPRRWIENFMAREAEAYPARTHIQLDGQREEALILSTDQVSALYLRVNLYEVSVIAEGVDLTRLNFIRISSLDQLRKHVRN